MAISESTDDTYPFDEDPAIWNPDNTLRKEDYFNQYLDGKQSPNDLEHEWGLGYLLRKLYERQREEAEAVLDRAYDRINPDGEEVEALKIYYKEFREDFHKECELFAKERDRHISEYHEAKAIRAEMNKESQQETLDADKSQERGISR
jgi:hypothetical protein